MERLQVSPDDVTVEGGIGAGKKAEACYGRAACPSCSPLITLTAITAHHYTKAIFVPRCLVKTP
jgi:hypothetical protein